MLYHEQLGENRVMFNYILYHAVCPMPAVAADFSPPDHRVQTRLLGGKK